MIDKNNSCEVRREQGFEVYVLSNREAEVAVVPELGARIISMKNTRTGREWMWHPEGSLKLFRNCPGDDFSTGSLVGMDECLPTIAPCTWRGRELPDHGEVWTASWTVNREAWKEGILRTSVQLPVSPFEFERTLELQGSEIRLGYHLKNKSAEEESFLWAMHPLLRLKKGDQLELPSSTRTLLNGERWVDALDSAIPSGNCAKAFAWPLREGGAAVRNPSAGDRLEFGWEPAQNTTLGVWLTRGGWHGHHHFALEPANGAADALTMAAAHNRCGIVAGCGSATWQISIRIRA